MKLKDYEYEYLLEIIEQKLKMLLPSQNKNGYYFRWDEGLCIKLDTEEDGFSNFKLMAEIMRLVNLNYVSKETFCSIYNKVLNKGEIYGFR